MTSIELECLGGHILYSEAQGDEERGNLRLRLSAHMRVQQNSLVCCASDGSRTMYAI